MQKQIRYVDQYDGPSSLISLSSTPKLNNFGPKQLNTVRDSNIYEEERKTFYSSFGTKKFFDLSPARRSQQIESTLVKNPQQRFEEYDSLRKSMKEYQNLKNEKQFLNKRDRLFKNTWKHGIVGVENPDYPKSDVYKQINTERHNIQAIKTNREKARQKVLLM
jgi:hypothetical protein